MDITPVHFELVEFSARHDGLGVDEHVGMRLEQAWKISEHADELTLRLSVALDNRSVRPNIELALCTVAARYAVAQLRAMRTMLPDALYLWIGRSTYDVIRGVMLGKATGTVLERILLPLPPDEAFLPDRGLRTISVN